MDPALLAEAVARKVRQGKPPKAVLPVHLYGQSADMHPILEICGQHGIPVIEDAAEALGSSYKGRNRMPGTLGKAGIFSFNGNKIIIPSGGGMWVSDDADFIVHARKLVTQARGPAPHYQHSEIGYNYRMSNVLAAIGRGQLQVLEERVQARRRNFQYYVDTIGDLPGIAFMPAAPWGRHTRWLTVITVDPSQFGVDRETIRLALEAEHIEARPVWKPMHRQPVFHDCASVGGGVGEAIFRGGLCLPSGANLSADDLSRVVEGVRSLRG